MKSGRILRLALVETFREKKGFDENIPVISLREPYRSGRVVDVHCLDRKVAFFTIESKTLVLEVPQSLSKGEGEGEEGEGEGEEGEEDE